MMAPVFGAMFYGGRTFSFSCSRRNVDTQVKLSALFGATADGEVNAELLGVPYYSGVLALGNLAVV